MYGLAHYSNSIIPPQTAAAILLPRGGGARRLVHAPLFVKTGAFSCSGLNCGLWALPIRCGAHHFFAEFGAQ